MERKKTRILLVEDQKIFSLSIKKDLEAHGYQVIAIAETGQQAIDFACGLRPDLILMDIILRDEMTGTEAVTKILNKVDIPIIYLSGKSSHLKMEDILVDGIYGYITKNMHLDELIFSLEIALNKFRNDQAIKYDQYFLNEAQRIAAIGHWKLDLRTNKLDWSDQAFRIFEKDKKSFEATYEAFVEKVHPEDREKVDNAYKISLETKLPYEVEHRIVTDTGEIRYVHEKGITLYDPEGYPEISIGTVQDITQSKLDRDALLQSELNFKQLFANSIDEVYLVDANNLKIIDANNAVIRKLGYSKEELCKLTVSDIKANHIVPNPILSRLDAVKNGEEVDYETVHQTKEGFIYPVRLKVKKIRYNGEDVFLGLGQDISSQKAIENDRAEQFEVRAIINDLLSINISEHTTSEYFNQVLSLILKLPFLGKLEKGAIYLLNKDARLKMVVARNIEEERQIKCAVISPGDCICGRTLLTKKIQFVCCDSAEKLQVGSLNDPIQANFNVPIIYNGEILGSYCIYSDIKTKKNDNHLNILETIGRTLGLILIRLRDHQNLITSENRFRELTDTIKEVFWLVDWENSKLLYVSPAYEYIYEQSCNSLFENPESWRKRIHPDDREKVIESYLNKGVLGEYDIEFRIQMNDGRIKWLHERAFPIWEGNKVVRMAGYSLEITDKKIVEHELIRSEEKYRTYVENSADVVCITDLDYNVFYKSPNNHIVFGYLASELVGHNVSGFVHPGDREFVDNTCKWLIKNITESRNIEYRYAHKSGSWIWVESSIKFVKKSELESYFIFNTRDISARKKIEENLKTSEERFRLLYTNNLSGLYRIDIFDRIIECNDAYAKILGFDRREKILNKKLSDLYDTKTNVLEVLLKNGGELKSFENYLVLKNGKIIRLLENAKLIFDENNKAQYYEGSSIDTTSLLEIEAEKKILEALPGESPNPVMRLDYDFNVIYENDASKKIRALVSNDNKFSSERINRFLDRFINSNNRKANVELQIGDSYYIFYAVNFEENRYVNLYGTDVTELENSKAAHLKLSLNLENLVIQRTNELKKSIDNLNYEIGIRKEAEQKIKRSLTEKEVLLNEITHRVKNNLQVISSLLSLQKNNIENQESIDLLSDTAHRIKSMALIHETLYRSSDFSQINFRSYIDSLIGYISNSFDTKNIEIITDVRDVILTIDTASSCGMIIMELITNSIKYAFPDQRSGILELKLFSMGDNYYKLIISDNGVGFPVGFNPEKTDTLGMQLVIGLTKQLHGHINFQLTNGSSIEIEFQDTKWQ